MEFARFFGVTIFLLSAAFSFSDVAADIALATEYYLASYTEYDSDHLLLFVLTTTWIIAGGLLQVRSSLIPVLSQYLFSAFFCQILLMIENFLSKKF